MNSLPRLPSLSATQAERLGRAQRDAIRRARDTRAAVTAAAAGLQHEVQTHAHSRAHTSLSAGAFSILDVCSGPQGDASELEVLGAAESAANAAAAAAAAADAADAADAAASRTAEQAAAAAANGAGAGAGRDAGGGRRGGPGPGAGGGSSSDASAVTPSPASQASAFPGPVPRPSQHGGLTREWAAAVAGWASDAATAAASSAAVVAGGVAGRRCTLWAARRAEGLAERLRQRATTFTAAPLTWAFLVILGVAVAAGGAGVEVAAASAARARVRTVDALPPVADYLAWTSWCAAGAVAATAICHLAPAPQAEGSGIPHLKSLMAGTPLAGVLSLRVLLAKVTGLVAAQGGGLAVGREGPFVHMAGAIASLLWQAPQFAALSRTESRRRQLLAAAVAAGVTAVFGTPVGAVLFSFEVTSTYTLVSSQWMCFVCAIVCRLAFDAFSGFREAGTSSSAGAGGGSSGGASPSPSSEEAAYTFTVSIPTTFRPAEAWEIPILALLGLSCGLLGSLFVFCLHKAKLAAKVLMHAPHHRPAVAAVAAVESPPSSLAEQQRAHGASGGAATDADSAGRRREGGEGSGSAGESYADALVRWCKTHWRRYALCAAVAVVVASLTFPAAFLARPDMDALRDLLMCPTGMVGATPSAASFRPSPPPPSPPDSAGGAANGTDPGAGGGGAGGGGGGSGGEAQQESGEPAPFSCPSGVWVSSRAAAVPSLALFLIVRMTAVLLSISLPLPCGMFQPLIVLGAAAGRMVGEAVASLTASSVVAGHAVQPGLYAVVGAAALVSGATHTISTAVILFELTGQAVHLVPVLLATLLAYAAAGAFTRPVYDVLLTDGGLPYLPRVHPAAAYASQTAGSAARPLGPRAVLCAPPAFSSSFAAPDALGAAADTYADALALLAASVDAEALATQSSSAKGGRGIAAAAGASSVRLRGVPSSARPEGGLLLTASAKAQHAQHMAPGALRSVPVVLDRRGMVLLGTVDRGALVSALHRGGMMIVGGAGAGGGKAGGDRVGSGAAQAKNGERRKGNGRLQDLERSGLLSGGDSGTLASGGGGGAGVDEEEEEEEDELDLELEAELVGAGRSSSRRSGQEHAAGSGAAAPTRHAGEVAEEEEEEGEDGVAPNPVSSSSSSSASRGAFFYDTDAQGKRVRLPRSAPAWMSAPLRLTGLVSGAAPTGDEESESGGEGGEGGAGPVVAVDPAPLALDAQTPLARLHFLFALLLLPHVLVTDRGSLVGAVLREDMCAPAHAE